jgi:hypothetical protein
MTGTLTAMTTLISQLPAEIHSSVHQIRHDQTLLGEYELRIFAGVAGPVVVLEAASSSPLPLEYLSERAVITFLEALPSSGARFFERHTTAASERWAEVGYGETGFVRAACQPAQVRAAVVASPGEPDQALVGEGRISSTYSTRR